MDKINFYFRIQREFFLNNFSAIKKVKNKYFFQIMIYNANKQPDLNKYDKGPT